MRISLTRLHYAVLMLPLCTGCACRTESLRRELGVVSHQLASLRATQLALRERIEAIEEATAAREAKTADRDPGERKQGSEDGGDRPELKVVRLTPEDQGSDGWTTIDPSDPPRPKRVTSPPSPNDGMPTRIHSGRRGSVVQLPPRAARGSAQP